MSLREVSSLDFARNLSRLCGQDESIAAVCRATRINRQQFARYLAGQSIPSEQNRRKICRYFNVTEAELFRSGEALRRTPGHPRSIPIGRRPASTHAEIGALLRLLHSDARPSISSGSYFLHFSELGKKTVLRSLLIVRHDDGLTTFRRLTGLAERRGSWWGQFLGDHRGIVVERAHWLYFVALNARGVREPSMLVLRWLPGAHPMLGGYALVNTADGPTPIAVVVSPCPLKFRAALRASHAYSSDDPTIDPLVIEELEEQTRILAAKTARSDLRVRRRAKTL